MATYYWVGGSGTWNTSTTTNWSLSSGGSGLAGVPTAADDVVIDANSGFIPTTTITVSGDTTPIFVNSIRITPNATTGSATISIIGTLTTNTLIVLGSTGCRRVRFTSSTQGTSANLIVVNRSSSLIADLDFRDIKVTGSYAPLSGTRLGNCGGNIGVTFGAPKTAYFIGSSTLQDATSWAATSGGAANTDYFPLPQDTAIIDNNSGSTMTVNTSMTYIGTLDSTARTTAFTITIASMNFAVLGDYKIGSGVSHSASSSSFTLNFEGRNKTQNIRSNGRTITNGFLSIFAIDSVVNLEDPISFTNGLTFYAGTFNTNNYNITTGSNSGSLNFQGIAGFNKVINFGYSTIVLTSIVGLITNATASLLTINASNSTINCTGTSSSAVAIEFGGFTWGTVNFQASRYVTVIQGLAQVTNLSFAQSAPGTNIVTLNRDLVVTGTLTTTSTNATTRTLISSSVLGTTRTITAAAVSLTDCDFKDITVAGTATWSGTRLGNCDGNIGITFPDAKTVYWNLSGSQNWYSTAWCTSTDGGATLSSPAVNNFPLAQDTAKFNEVGLAGTIALSASNIYWNIGTIDMSARTTTTMTLTHTLSTSTFTVHGDWVNGNGIANMSASGSIIFAGRRTQTITSAGKTFGSAIITVNSVNGTLAFIGNFTTGNTLNLNSGTLNAGTAAITAQTFNSSTATVKTLYMGSSIWTLTGGAGGVTSIWNISGSNYTVYKETADIVFSDATASTTRNFTGGYLSYNKLTIGGGTATGQIVNINSADFFTEIASTKTVAWTINILAANTVFGLWTITGTVGNVVTVGGSGTISLLSRTTGIDYLAMGTVALYSDSPGEFYAGVNSTGTGAGITKTAAPASSRTLYWRGGSGTWDGSTTTNWALTSGAVSGGQAPPTSIDDVIFNSGSGSGTITVTTATVTIIRCRSITLDCAVGSTLAFSSASIPIAIHGDLLVPASNSGRFGSFNVSHIYMCGAGRSSIINSYASGANYTTAPAFALSAITFIGIGTTWTLSNHFYGGTSLNIIYGTLNTNGYDYFTTGSLNTTINLSSNTVYNPRGITLGASLFYCNNITLADPSTGFTFTPGTSTITLTTSTTSTITTSGQSFYNLSFARPASTAAQTIALANNITVTNALSMSSTNVTAIARIFIRSTTIGSIRTITANSLSGSFTDLDFRDIALAGSAGTLTGTRIGDCGGNSGITFATPKTVYWNLAGAQNWNATAWCTSSNGGVTLNAAAINNFPLAQDTAVFNTVGSVTATITINLAVNIGTIDMSARTNTAYPMLLASGTQAITIYGSYIGGSGVTRTGTAAITFAGRGTQTITSAGRQITNPITIDNVSGTVQLSDNLFTNAAMILTSGTFSAINYNVTCTTFTSNNSNSRTLNMGTGVWTLTSTGVVWQCVTSTNMTLNAQTSNILLIDNTTTARTFAGGSLTYNKLTVGGSLGISILTITGNNTFNELASIKTVASTITFGSSGTQTIGTLSASGYYKNVLTLLGSSVTTPVFLNINNCLANNILATFVRSSNTILNLGNTSSGYGNFNVIFSETNLLLNRLTAAGDLQVSGTLDDGTNAFIELDGINKITYAPEFDDYTSTGGIERKIYSNSYVIDGVFDEVTLNPYSISLNGINQYLSIPANSAFNFGTGDFTIEGWFYFNSFTGNTILIDQYPAATTGAGNWQLWVNTVGTFSFSYNGSTAVASSTLMALNTWYHIAACRIGTWTNNLGIFLNGVRVGTATYTGTVGRSDTTIWIGAQHLSGPTGYPNCYVSNLRILNGVGLYPWNPPTQALSNVYETSLLTAQSATIVDNSPNALTITNPNGVAVSSSVVPFANTYSYSFNGTNQYLALPINTFNSNNNSFTIEMWLYPTAYPGGTNTAQLFQCSNATVGSFGGFNFTLYNDGQLRLDVRPTTGGANVSVTTTSAIPLNTWTHVALSVNNGAAIIFINGVNSGTATIVVMDRTQTFCSIGYLTNGYTTLQTYYAGYISNVRVIKNIGLYSTNFNPIGPLSVLSGSTTSLLTGQNIDIVDNGTGDSGAPFTITNNNNTTTKSLTPFR